MSKLHSKIGCWFTLRQIGYLEVLILSLLTFLLAECGGESNLDSEYHPLHIDNTPHSRQKRFIYFNTQSPVDIGLLITIPLSFALPTFNLKTSRRFSRSVDGGPLDLTSNMTLDEIFPADSYDEAAYASELNKMSTYFTILEINEDICQQRILCEIFSEPDKYKPVTDIFMKKLTVDRGPVDEKAGSRYNRYVKAMQGGITSGIESCVKNYKACPYSATERLNMPALHFWTYLTSILKMEFRDE